jgi:hypothetical protein
MVPSFSPSAKDLHQLVLTAKRRGIVIFVSSPAQLFYAYFSRLGTPAALNGTAPSIQTRRSERACPKNHKQFATIIHFTPKKSPRPFTCHRKRLAAMIG